MSIAGADVVGTLNVHTSLDGRRTTGQDSGLPITIQIDFSRTQDGTYDITVWTGERQLDPITRVYVEEGKATQRKERYQTGSITVSCPATDLKENAPTSFQVFVQSILDNGEKGGKVPIAEADWQLGSIEDNQPGQKIAPRQIICSAGSNLDQHATGSFIIKNQGEKSVRATLFFGGRKYGEYSLGSHGDQKIQADAWGVNPGVGWYVTTPNPLSPNGKQIEAAGPIYNTEGGSEGGFNRVDLSSASPTPGQSASPGDKR
jgi:hypothetical protein